MAVDSSRLEVKSWTALLDMHMLAVNGPVTTVFRYLCRSIFDMPEWVNL